MNGKEVIRKLEAAGWTLARITGKPLHNAEKR